ncbi:MAG: hypothetical protein DME97_08665 [Verrucomicrobia bacterium]|nr:MAG: hypothetical protein DME97_08665 [Verrucomicrobiota bacterium]
MSSRFLPGSLIALAIFASACAFAARPTISEDRELKEIDLARWDCRDRPEGTAKTPDGAERNRLKNRSTANLTGTKPVSLETATFLQYVAAFDAQTKGTRRKDLSAELRRQLEPLEKQIVSVEGYLVLAYAGPPESTNCGSMDFHDWHIEIFENPLDHAPQIGDATPIICEITPHTQTALFRDNIRMQTLAGFIRAPDLTIEPTGHAARRIRVTGYLLWDDEHNGAADIGTVIRMIGANKYHQPWRRTAWEIHPAIKIEALDATMVSPAVSPASAPPSPTAPISSPTPVPASPRSSQSQQQFVTITKPVKIKILYGETVIPAGTRLRLLSHDAQTVTVNYLEGTYVIPISSTDFR